MVEGTGVNIFVLGHTSQVNCTDVDPLQNCLNEYPNLLKLYNPTILQLFTYINSNMCNSPKQPSYMSWSFIFFFLNKAVIHYRDEKKIKKFQ